MNNIQHLRYAVEVAKTGSISRAAENLFMGQPHLSKAIRELEEDMNITIFRRTPKGVEPTEQGEQFLEYARRILEQVDELESLYKPSGVKKFSLSLPRASYAAFAFSEFAAALDDAEGLDVKYRETNSTQVLKNVGDGVSNLGYCAASASTKNISSPRSKNARSNTSPCGNSNTLRSCRAAIRSRTRLS